MPITNRTYYNKTAERHGVYYVHRYRKGGFNVWKRGWAVKGLDVPSDERLRELYRQQTADGRVLSDWLGTKIAVRAVLVDGVASRAKGREILGLPATKRRPRDERLAEAKAAVKDYFEPRRVRAPNGVRYYVGKKVEDERRAVTAFMKDHPSIYKFLARNCGGFKEQVEKWFPRLYDSISQRRLEPDSHEKEKLANTMRRRFNLGLCVAPTLLKNSIDPEERELYRRVCASGEKLLLGEQSYSRIVADWVGVEESSILASGPMRLKLGMLAEDFTEAIFLLGDFLDMDHFGFGHGFALHNSREYNQFGEKGDKHIADLRVRNIPIEIKTAMVSYTPSKVNQQFTNRYLRPGLKWDSGETLEKVVAVFHARPELHVQVNEAVSAAGGRVIGYKDMHDSLREIAHRFKAHSHFMSDVKPAPNWTYLVDLHEEMSHHPFMLLRKDNGDRFMYSYYMIRALIKESRKLRGEHGS